MNSSSVMSENLKTIQTQYKTEKTSLIGEKGDAAESLATFFLAKSLM